MNHHCFLILIIITTLLHLSTPSGCSFSTKGLGVEEKTRLGSTPPSCHSKCNECHPCFAVQVPAVPSLNRVSLRPSSTPYPMDFYNLPGNRYSPYKPLSWKCRCKNCLYNP